MATVPMEPYVLDFPDGERVDEILKKAEADYSREEIDVIIGEVSEQVEQNKTDISLLKERVEELENLPLAEEAEF